MNTTNPSIKTASKVALAAIAALLVITIIFFKERALFADSAFAIFNIINDKSIYIINQRYGSLIARVLPYLQVELHSSIKAIVMGYAISSTLFLLIVAALTVYYYKLYHFAILIAFYCFLIVSDSFYMLADTHVGIGWMFLFFATTIRLGYKQVNLIVLSIPFILLAFLTVTTHFIVIIPTIFLWVYLILDKDMWPFSAKKTIVLSGLLVIALLSKFLLTADKSYDNHLLHGVTHLSIQDIIDSFSCPTVKIFYYRCIVNYWVVIILFVAGNIYLALARKKLLLAWSVMSVAGYISLMGITYAGFKDDFTLCHIELEWQCLGLIAATPFVFSFLPKIKPAASALVLSAIFIVRFVYIGHSISALEYRYQYSERIMAQMRKKGITKLALYEDAHIRQLYQIDWAVGHESLIASAMSEDKQQLSFFFITWDRKDIVETLKAPRVFWNGFNIKPPWEINHEYFNPDTTHGYQVMMADDLFR